MKWHFAIFLLFLSPSLVAQYTGSYRMELDSTQAFIVKTEKQKLWLEIPGQGQTVLTPLGGNRYQPEGVRPVAVIEFLPDSHQFHWLQDVHATLEKVRSDGSDYAGSYRVNSYVSIQIVDTNNVLTVRQGKAMPISLHPLSKDQFIFDKNGLLLKYDFTRNSQGVVTGLKITRTGPQVFMRVNTQMVYEGQDFSDHHPFTRADSLRGALTKERACYDVRFYDLEVRVMPEERMIIGRNTIHFNVTMPCSVLQVDLFASLDISRIQYHGQSLPFRREFNAVFIRFPASMQPGVMDSITINYKGQPRGINMEKLQGGFIWMHDRDGNPWIESVTQGSGASLWWPCKDHQSDKPDSMHIAITVPDTLMDISNGSLQGITPLPDQLRRFDWAVHYPISTYDVAVNIGKFAHYSAIYGQDSMPLHYYYLPYNDGFAKYLFKGIPAMMALYEKSFGPFPFKKDGLTLVEGPYPMEHQGAVSTGAFTSPLNSATYDTAEVTRVTWHEAAHEWWGNSVTCSDITELWMHEAFATYAEVLCYEHFGAPGAALRYKRQQNPGNKSPVIGSYEVNDFHMGDIYPKGVRIVLSLQAIVNNDSLWFDLLKGIQQHFRYQSLTTAQLVAYINQHTQKDLTPFFDQYLRYRDLPEFLFTIKGERLQYKWKADVPGFNMPVRVSISPNKDIFIYPTTTWQTMQIPGMRRDDFKVDRENFLIR